MIEQVTFFGFSLHTARRRRTVVMAYYGLLLLFVVLVIVRAHNFLGPMLAMTFALGGLLGGLRPGGPVKYFANTDAANPPRLPLLDGSGIQQLNLSGPPRRAFLLFTGLDERERLERDRAHYTAYRLLIRILLIAAIPLVTAMFFFPAPLVRNAPVLLWLLLLVVMSLPQAVILWTEKPEPGDGELHLASRPV